MIFMPPVNKFIIKQEQKCVHHNIKQRFLYVYKSGSKKNKIKNMKKGKRKGRSKEQELMKCYNCINSLLIKHVTSIPNRTGCHTLRPRNNDEMVVQKGGEARDSPYVDLFLITVLVSRLDLCSSVVFIHWGI